LSPLDAVADDDDDLGITFKAHEETEGKKIEM
jgi:hypothetical protein